MRFHSPVGVLPHESSLPQPIEIDLTVWRATPADTAILDYRSLYALAARALAPSHTSYLEEVAERVVAGALELPGVASVRVAVRKPHVALPGPLGYAEVIVERDRHA